MATEIVLLGKFHWSYVQLETLDALNDDIVQTIAETAQLLEIVGVNWISRNYI